MWVRCPPEAWFLSFGRWEDKPTAMAYATDFQDPRVLGDVLPPWPGDGDTLEFRDLAAIQVWEGVQFATERLGGRGQRRMGAALDSDDPCPRAGVSRTSGEGGRRRRGADVESARGIGEPVSEESSCSDEGSLSEPPPSPPRRPRRTTPPAKAGRPHVRPSPKTAAGGRGGGGGSRNVTRSLSLRKPPLPPMGEIHPLRRAPEGGGS